MREKFDEIMENIKLDVTEDALNHPLETLSNELLECAKDLRFYYNKYKFEKGEDTAKCYYTLKDIKEELTNLEEEIVEKSYGGATINGTLDMIIQSIEEEA